MALTIKHDGNSNMFQLAASTPCPSVTATAIAPCRKYTPAAGEPHAHTGVIHLRLPVRRGPNATAHAVRSAATEHGGGGGAAAKSGGGGGRRLKPS